MLLKILTATFLIRGFRNSISFRQKLLVALTLALMISFKRAKLSAGRIALHIFLT